VQEGRLDHESVRRRESQERRGRGNAQIYDAPEFLKHTRISQDKMHSAIGEIEPTIRKVTHGEKRRGKKKGGSAGDRLSLSNT